MMRKSPIVGLVVSLCLSAAVLPAQANTMLGAYINHDGWSLADIDKFNTDAAKPLAVVNLFTNFDMHWDSLYTQSSNIVSRGGTPMITLMPYSSSRNPDMLTAIANGDEDNYLNSWIASFKNWRDAYPVDARPSILLRFGHEFNGNWYPWSNNPAAFIAAWRHVHNLFELSGVNGSVEWVWCVNNVNVDSVNDITRYYPGDDVVDWTSIDGYNWGSSFSFSRWKSFDETFSSSYVKLVTNYPAKPVIIAEVASAEPGDLPNAALGQDGNDADAGQNKDLWVQDMYQRIKDGYPAIRAVAWFNTNKELSWALNETALSGAPNTGLAGYNAVVGDAWFLGTFTPTKTTTTTGGGTTDTSTKGRKTSGGGKGGKTTTTMAVSTAETGPVSTSDVGQLPGVGLMPDVSRLPDVSGEDLLALEAAGFRSLPAEALGKIRSNRLSVTP